MAEHQELAPLERGVLSPLNHRIHSQPDLGVEPLDAYSYPRVYWQVLRKRVWTVLTVAVLLTALVAIVSFKMQPIYEAPARVEVEAETPQIQSFNDLYRTMPSDDAFLQTQLNVLKSDNLAWQTIQQLGLGKNLEIMPSHQRDAEQGSEPPTDEQISLIRGFRSHLRVELVRNSRILEITFASSDPKLAARVANGLVNSYIEYNFHKRYDATRQASGWMEQQLDDLKAKVENSQQAMVDYERQNAIVNINDKQTVAEQRLADLSRDLTNAESDRMQKESLYQLVNTNESQIALIAQDALLQRVEEKYIDLKGQYADALGQYGLNYPKVVRLREQVSELQSIMERERKRIVSRMRNDYLAALGREKLLSAAVAQERIEVGKLNQLSIQHNILKRDFETNQQLYENLLQRLKDATVSAGLRATNIHIVDSALLPKIPVRPRKLLNTAIGLVVGLALGMMLAFVQESLDDSIKNVEELERLTAVPSLAVIPKTSPLWLKSRAGKSGSKDGAVELAVLNQPVSALGEAYRTLRTSILLATAPSPPQALLVTSAQPKEGKTSTSLNLALGLAQRGVRVLLIDADLRRPGIAAALRLPGEKGLSSVLSGTHSLNEALRRFNGGSNLWILPAGPCPLNPADLLSSPRLEELFKELRQRFDHLVVDSCPSLMMADATILSTFVDGVVLVVESGSTPRGAVLRAQKIIESVGGKVLGTVLNKLDLRRDGYYGYTYRNYYRSYYPGNPMSAAPKNKQPTAKPTGFDSLGG